MPNHVKNIIKLTGAQNEINYIVNLITKTEEVDGETQRVVDFNSLIPMPETLNVVSGGCADECLKLYISDVFCNDDIYGTKLKKHLDVLQRYNNSKLFGKINITTEHLYTLAEISDKCSKLLEQYHADRKRIPFDEGPWFRTTADVIAYGEQIYNNIEKYTREFNYPDHDFVVSKDDLKEKGLKTFFFSDASGAISAKVFKEVNGYDQKRLPISEDMYIIYKWRVSDFAISC